MGASSFLRYLNEVLKEQNIDGSQEPKVIDINSQAERMWALDNCRGPNVGWAQYVAGEDYQPPMYYNSNVPLGPLDRGASGIADSKDRVAIEFEGTNPHSKKYGGIRPWSPNEIVITMYTRTGERASEGLFWRIVNKSSSGGRRSGRLGPMSASATTKAVGGSWDEHMIDWLVHNGVQEVLTSLHKDQARMGTRFTAWIGEYIQNAMAVGAKAGYGNEYRTARGLLNRIEKSLKQIVKAVSSDADFTQPLQEFQSLLGSIDPNPGPQNEYGVLFSPQWSVQREVTPLLKLGEEVMEAAAAGNMDVLNGSLDMLGRIREKVEEDESTGYSVGAAKDTLIAKSRDQAPIRTVPVTKPGKDTEKEQEVTNIRRFGSSSDYLHGEEVKEMITAALYLLRKKTYESESTLRAISSIKNLVGGAAGQDTFDKINTIVTKADKYGEFADELKLLGGQLIEAIQSGDDSMVSQTVDELDDLAMVAKQDKLSGDKELTTQEYRVLLRKYGVEDYPEKDTPDDPELDFSEDPNGVKSWWAQMGYPTIINNKDIGKELGTDPKTGAFRPISAERVSTIYNNALPKFKAAIDKLRQRNESLDTVDKAILEELSAVLSTAIVAECMSPELSSVIKECRDHLRGELIF